MAVRVVPRTNAAGKFYYLEGELREFQKVACSGVYLRFLKATQAVQAKFFHREAAKDRAVNHGAAKRSVRLRTGVGQVAHEAAGKTVTRASGIVRFFQGKCGHAEDAVFIDKHGAVFAPL